MKPVVKTIMTAALLAVLTVFSAVLVAPVTPAAVAGPPAGAAGDTVAYTINDLDMTVFIPDDLVVFKRPIDPADPNLTFFGLQKAWLDNNFRENNVYLNAIPEDILYEFFISMKTDPAIAALTDFSATSDDVLRAYIDQAGYLYRRDGETYVGSDIYRNDHAAFIKSYSERFINDRPAYVVSYFTVTNGMAIDLYLRSYDSSMTALAETILRRMADSAVLPVTAEPEPSSSPSPSVAPSPSASPSPVVSPSPVASPSPSVIPSPSPSAEPSPQPSDTGSQVLADLPLPMLLIVYVCLTFAVVTLPVIIYRYAIRRRPVPGKTSVLIALVYGNTASIAAIIYIFFSGAFYLIVGVLLWSVVNYFILSGGHNASDSPPPRKAVAKPVSDTQPAAPDAVLRKQCKKCLAVNLPDSEKCFYCGAKLGDESPAG